MVVYRQNLANMLHN